jgi:hypothetical protein
MRHTRFPRIRFTISALMALVAAIAVLTMLVLPLIRLGKCPAQTPVQTAQWLLNTPGKASCTDCHSAPKPPAGGGATLALKPAAESCPVMPNATASRSCMACHTNRATTSKTLPKN